MGNVIELAKRRQAVWWTVRIGQHWDDSLEVFVEDIGSDDRSRQSAAAAMRRAADLIENLEVEAVQTE